MHIRIDDNKLKRALEDDSERQRRFGKPMAKKIRLRMDALAAADSLFDFWPPYSGPERCHELKGQLAGTFSMDVKQPYRLLMKEDDEKTEQRNEKIEDEKQRWMAIKAVQILGIEDTHG